MAESPKSVPYPTLRLDAVTEDHLHVFQDWFVASRPETQTCRPWKQKPIEEVIQIYRDRPKPDNSEDFAVVRVSDSQLVGRVRYFSLNTRNRSAEIGYLIGPEYQGQGYATVALALLLDLLFRTKSPNKVYAQTGEFNHPSIALLRRWGFKQDGRLRQHHVLDGVMYDDLVFSLLAEEYKQVLLTQSVRSKDGHTARA